MPPTAPADAPATTGISAVTFDLAVPGPAPADTVGRAMGIDPHTRASLPMAATRPIGGTLVDLEITAGPEGLRLRAWTIGQPLTAELIDAISRWVGARIRG